jgi:hypothetical protein
MLKYHYGIALFICYLCYWFRNDEMIWITCTQTITMITQNIAET